MVSFVMVGLRLMKEHNVKLAWHNSRLVSILVPKDLFGLAEELDVIAQVPAMFHAR